MDGPIFMTILSAIDFANLSFSRNVRGNLSQVRRNRASGFSGGSLQPLLSQNPTRTADAAT